MEQKSVEIRKEQIEEMAKLACTCFDGNCKGCPFDFYPPCPPKASAKRIYNAGYRKQEWISVSERLPDGIGDFLVVVKMKYSAVLNND